MRDYSHNKSAIHEASLPNQSLTNTVKNSAALARTLWVHWHDMFPARRTHALQTMNSVLSLYAISLLSPRSTSLYFLLNLLARFA